MLKEQISLGRFCQKFHCFGSSTSVRIKSYLHPIELVLKIFIMSLLSRLVRKNVVDVQEFCCCCFFFLRLILVIHIVRHSSDPM